MRTTKVLVILSLLIVSSAWAVDGSIGCGPGNSVNPQNTWIGTTTRGVTNYICSFTVTGGTTSGTSGCQKHTIVKNEYNDMFFIQSNLEILAVEMAQGKGEYISGLAKTLGCDQVGSQKFIQKSKNQYNSIYSRDRYGLKLLDNVHKLIDENPDLSAHCKRIII